MYSDVRTAETGADEEIAAAPEPYEAAGGEYVRRQACCSGERQAAASRHAWREEAGEMDQEAAAGAEAEARTGVGAGEHAQEGRHAERRDAEAVGLARVLERGVYRGPNLYGYRPVIRFMIDLGALEAFPTSRLEGFTDRLLEAVPTLHNHGCSYREPGGFVRRMREGTWLGHVAEHLAMELQCLAGTQVTYGKTRSAGERTGVYNVIYSYLEERTGLLAGWLALRLIDSLLPEELMGIQGLNLLVPPDTAPLAARDAPFDFEAEMEALIRLAQHLSLGPTTRSLVDEAKRRGIPAIRLDDQSLVQLGYGKYQKRIRASVTSHTALVAADIAGNKALTARLLIDAGLPAPRNIAVQNPDEAVSAARKLGFPLVTKPLDANHGRGVSLNLADEEQVRWGFEQAKLHSRTVLVEQFFRGSDYRVLVVDGRLVAAAHRVPAHVVGDGEHTVAELIEIANQDPLRGIGHEKVMTRITVDAQVERVLSEEGRTLETVPAPGEGVFLRETGNMSTGGTARDVTREMHPDNVRVCEMAARVVGLDVAGIDLICPDITQSVCDTGGGIVEINAAPGFRMHLAPSEGRRRNVARPVLDMLFPNDTPCRIPVVAITGTNGKTTTSRIVAHILKGQGKRVGLTTSTGIYVDGQLYASGDTTGPKSAQIVLRDPTIDAAVLETARGGILREGLGFDRCDVGAVLNISEDHLGAKGVETVRDLAWVKSLVVEVVGRDGASVLNADDPLTYRMRYRAGGRLILFSMRGGENAPEHLREHIRDGGSAVVCQPGLRGDLLALYEGERYEPLLWAHEIPATLGGKARFNVTNALAAAAVARGMGVPAEGIRAGLRTFATTFEENPGRLNVVEGLPFKVILDYAHNPDGMRQMADLVAGLRAGHGRVITSMTGTGDRRDEDIRLLGELAARMSDELVIRETPLQRGRARGEVPALVREGALRSGIDPTRVHYVEEECAAVSETLRRARPGDLVLLFCDSYKLCHNCVLAFRAGLERRGAAELNGTPVGVEGGA